MENNDKTNIIIIPQQTTTIFITTKIPKLNITVLKLVTITI